MRLARRETVLSPPVKYFTDRSKAVLLLWIFYIFSVLWLLCLCAHLFICLDHVSMYGENFYRIHKDKRQLKRSLSYQNREYWVSVFLFQVYQARLRERLLSTYCEACRGIHHAFSKLSLVISTDANPGFYLSDDVIIDFCVVSASLATSFKMCNVIMA